MKKIILFTTVLLSSVRVYATCNPPRELKCNCQHPIINSAGQLACGEDYCAANGKKCMPDGSCCLNNNYCESIEKGKQCCSDGQSCDTTSGCVEAKNIETKCANAEGTIATASSGTFCMSNSPMSWYDAEAWCQRYGMTMPTLKEMCPSWQEGYISCPELLSLCCEPLWSATIDPNDSEFAYGVNLASGNVNDIYNARERDDAYHAFCH